MDIRLDSTHKLVYKNKSWTMYKLVRISPYSKEKVKQLKKDNKPCIIMEDTKGNKCMAIWKRLTSYGLSELGMAIQDWINETILENEKDIGDSIDELIKLFGRIEDKLNKIIIMSSLIKMKIELKMVSDSELKKLEEEKKRNTVVNNKSKKTTKGRKREIIIGPDIVFAPSVISSIKTDKKLMKWFDCSDVVYADNVFGINKDGIEYVKTNSIGMGRRGRRKKTVTAPEIKIKALKPKNEKGEKNKRKKGKEN